MGGSQKVGRPVSRVVANTAGSILVKGLFFGGSSAKMRLFKNLGIWVDFFYWGGQNAPLKGDTHCDVVVVVVVVVVVEVVVVLNTHYFVLFEHFRTKATFPSAIE